MSVVFDAAEGYARLGPVDVPIRLNSRDGTLQLEGAGGSIVRPLTFTERTRLITYALMSPNPRQAIGKLVVEAALQQIAPADPLILAIIAMALAGGSEADLPSYSETALLLSQTVGWSPAQFGETQALEVDQLVKQVIPKTDNGWTRLVFSDQSGTDLQTIYNRLADNLLSRAQPKGLAQHNQLSAAYQPSPLGRDAVVPPKTGKWSQLSPDMAAAGSPAHFQTVNKILFSSESTPAIAPSNTADNSAHGAGTNLSSIVNSQITPEIPAQVAWPDNAETPVGLRQDYARPERTSLAADKEWDRPKAQTSPGSYDLPDTSTLPAAAAATPVLTRPSDNHANGSHPLMPGTSASPTGQARHPLAPNDPQEAARPSLGISVGSHALQGPPSRPGGSPLAPNPGTANTHPANRTNPLLPATVAPSARQAQLPLAIDNSQQASLAAYETISLSQAAEMARLLQAVDFDIDELVAEIARQLQLEADLRGINR